MKTKKALQEPEQKKLLTNGPNASNLPHEAVKMFAYQIWDQEGRIDGHDVDHWLQAERQLEEVRSRESAPV